MNDRRRKEAQSLAEFALLLPVLLVILLGIFDFGRAIYAYNAVSNAAREGGRTAIVNQTPEHIRERAAQQATALGVPSTDPGGCPGNGQPTTTAAAGVCVGLRAPTPADLSAPCPTPATIGCVAVVSVKWTFTAITPVIGNIIGPIPISATTRQAIESVCSPPKSCPTQATP